MGYRIHKVLGYGLTDVQTEEGQIADPRINTASPLLDLDAPDPQLGYDQWLKAEEDSMDAALELAMFGEKGCADVRGVCTWRSGDDMPNVLVVTPAGFPTWRRHDDPIDYEEEMLRGEGMEPRVVRTLGGIYPYNGLHMDVRTGERIKDTTVNLWRRVANDLSSDDLARPATLDALARTLGFASHAEAEQMVAPWVPDSVRWACAWGELFTSPDIWRQLRPLLYTYWA